MNKCPYLTSIFLFICLVKLNGTSCIPIVYSIAKEKTEFKGSSQIYESSEQENSILFEFGLLTNVEDTGYPFFTLTFEFPARGFTEYFSLNIEMVPSIDAATLTNAIGKYVAFEFTSDIKNALLDVTLEAKSLFYESKVPVFSSGIIAITGTLSNAAEETYGDLPGELYISTEEEITEKFDFFITPQLVMANGKTVVGYYEK